jgi:hypothetical protein
LRRLSGRNSGEVDVKVVDVRLDYECMIYGCMNMTKTLPSIQS